MKALKYLLIISMMAALSGQAFAELKHDSVIFIMDVSGSISQSEVNRGVSVLSKMNGRFPTYVQSSGLLVIGQTTFQTLAWELPVGPYSKTEMAKTLSSVKNDIGSTPLGIAVATAGPGVDKAIGKTALVIVSDGLNNDMADPAVQVKHLKAKHGSNLCVYTIQLGDSPAGAQTLARMVDAGECGEALKASDLAMGDDVKEVVMDIFPKMPDEMLAVRDAKDADGDGIFDSYDQCPNTKKGAKVNQYGCVPPPMTECKPMNDADKDGVADEQDACPDTLAGADVDERGCWEISNILFDFDNDEIKYEFIPELETMVKVLNANPELHVLLEGHTDPVGGDSYNQKLSEERAVKVFKYLLGRGISESRISYKGYGEKIPVAPNDTEEGRYQNRRVEMKLLK